MKIVIFVVVFIRFISIVRIINLIAMAIFPEYIVHTAVQACGDSPTALLGLLASVRLTW